MSKAIDRLFQRLGATYGSAWDKSLGNAPIGDVKTVWEHELMPFSNALHRIAWALENLPERCPNAIEFKKLCYSAPSPDTPRLPEPKADPERLAAELAKLAPMREQMATQPMKDCRKWARDILDNPKGRTPAVLQMARNAVGAQ